MRSIESKYGLTYIMGEEISFCETLKEFGTYYKSKMNERQVQIAEDLRNRKETLSEKEIYLLQKLAGVKDPKK